MNFEPDGKAKIRIMLNDRRYGVSTEGIIESTDAGIQDEMARNLAIKYAPTREAVMRHILQRALTGQLPPIFHEVAESNIVRYKAVTIPFLVQTLVPYAAM